MAESGKSGPEPHHGAMSVVVCGSFGFLNAGDEAVPLAVADIAQDLGLSVKLAKLSRWEATPDQSVLDLGPAHESKRKDLSHSAVLYAGGGIIDASPNCVLRRCHGHVREMHPRSISALAVSVESGVRYSWMTRRRLRRYLGDMSHISVRDAVSYDSLTAILGRKDVEVAGDLVLSMRAEEPHGFDLPEKPFLAVTLAPVWSHELAWRNWIARELAAIAEELDLSVFFVPCSPGEKKDLLEHEAVAQMTRSLTAKDVSICRGAGGEPRKLAGIYARASLTVGLRLHACIMSWAQRTPFAGVAYHPKLTGFARTAGVSDWLIPNELPSQQTPGAYGYAWAQLGLRKNALLNVAGEAISRPVFDALDMFKETQRHLLRHILDAERK